MEGTPRILFNNKITKSQLRSTMPQPLGASQNIYTVAMAHSYMILLRFESRQTLVASEKKREKNKYIYAPKQTKRQFIMDPFLIISFRYHSKGLAIGSYPIVLPIGKMPARFL